MVRQKEEAAESAFHFGGSQIEWEQCDRMLKQKLVQFFPKVAQK